MNKNNSLRSVILFYLDNNRQAFIETLINVLPDIVLQSFYANIDNIDNEELSQLLAGFLAVGNRLKIFSEYDIPYNLNAANYTTEESSIFEAVKKINNVKDDLTLSEYINQKSETEWWTALGDFFGGSTEPATSQTTETKQTINYVAVLSVLATLFGFAFLVFKFYRPGRKKAVKPSK